MAIGQKKQRWTLFSRESEPEEYLLEGYSAGRVRESIPVRVAPDTAVVSDIIAPQVVVEGLVHGFIIARELFIAATGRVWGDVYATAVTIAPQGQLNGWLSTIDEQTYTSLYENPQVLVNLAASQNGSSAVKALPPQLHTAANELLNTLPPERVGILHLLQQEAGTALAARLELEQEFERRLDETHVQALNEATSLRQQEAMFLSKQGESRQQIADLQAQLDVRARELGERTAEISTAHHTIEKQADELLDLQTHYSMQTAELSAAQQRIEQLQGQVQLLERQAEATAERIHSLDIALQDSLQRGSEQEEALVRWQELAELTEKQAKEAKAELDTLSMQQREGAQTLAIMRDQRNRLEQEWDKAQDEITKLKKQLAAQAEQPNLAGQVAQLQKELERKVSELNLTKQAMVESTGALAQAKRQMEFAEQDLKRVREQEAALGLAQEQIRKLHEEQTDLNQELNHIQGEHRLLKVDSERRITALQQDNQRARERLQEMQGQMTASQAVLQAAEAKLQQATEREQQQEKLVARLGHELQQAQQAQANQVPAVELETLRAQLATLKADYSLQQSQVKQLKEEVQSSRSRLQAFEQEVETYRQQIGQQGGRVAELQGELVEHDLRYKQVLAGARKQAAELQQIKQAAQQRIAALQADVQKARQQVQDLTAVLERYRKK
ncbi:MAG: polymer-forming cytoskeletal protein [Chloroflexi bacterium]|nr:polymer-forming cytoskeletal protein [Chloroflexota bacterium]